MLVCCLPVSYSHSVIFCSQLYASSSFIICHLACCFTKVSAVIPSYLAHIIIAWSSYAGAVLGIVILSVCLSIRPLHACSVTKWMYCWYFDTTWKGNHSSFLTPIQVDGRCPLPPEICASSDPPPLKIADWPISAHNVRTVRASKKCSTIANRKSTTRFPTSYRWSAYITPNFPKGWLINRICCFCEKNSSSVK